MPRRITYTGALKKIKGGIIRREIDTVLWNMLNLMVRNLEEDPEKLKEFSMDHILRLTSLLKDVQKMKDKEIEQQEEQDFLDRLDQIQKKKNWPHR